MGKYISSHTGEEIDAAVDAVDAVAEKLENQTQSTIDDTVSYVDDQQAIKKYVAIINQSGSSAPVATVLENTIGNIVWSRVATGTYLGTLNGAFPVNKVLILSSMGVGGPAAEINSARAVDNFVYLVSISNSTYNPVDSALVNANIEIRVYP